MKIKTEVFPYTLQFKQPAGTSRGIYTTRRVWYIRLTDSKTGRRGIGECAPLPALSCDDLEDYETILREQCRELERTCRIDYEALRPYPSMLFGMETAWLQLNAPHQVLYDTPFTRGEIGIPINGLIWMGNYEEMYQRIQQKMKAGFRCIKLKIGAIDFEQELDLLKYIRSKFSRNRLELRVDANGAFAPDEAFGKLEELSKLGLHSIEQPIFAGQWDEMARLCKSTPLPIALDEELIGINQKEDKIRLLDTICPQYIILKPSLHGGIHGSEEWIQLAEERGIQWWITSALESNVGLNAIAQWCATLNPTLPQGLGTGLLFRHNVDAPLYIQGDCLWYQPEEPMDFDLAKFLKGE